MSTDYLVPICATVLYFFCPSYVPESNVNLFKAVCRRIAKHFVRSSHYVLNFICANKRLPIEDSAFKIAKLELPNLCMWVQSFVICLCGVCFLGGYKILI